MLVTPDEQSALLRNIADDPKLIEAARIQIEDLVIEMRDSGMFVLNRNGIAAHNYDGTPNGLIRISTAMAIQIALREIADHIAAQTTTER